MFIVESYGFAVALCCVTMLCWGSWGNTQKLAAKTWRYELFYWDYVIGILIFSLCWGITLGSVGGEGRPFLDDLSQVSLSNFFSALLGGIVFNASNILLSSSMNAAIGDKEISSYRGQSQLMSYLFRINYNLLDKYLMTFSIRRDGSSRLALNRWNNFYSGAIA